MTGAIIPPENIEITQIQTPSKVENTIFNSIDSSPFSMAYNSKTNLIYVLDYNLGKISILNDTKNIIGTIDLSIYVESTNFQFIGIICDENKNFLYVTVNNLPEYNKNNKSLNLSKLFFIDCVKLKIEYISFPQDYISVNGINLIFRPTYLTLDNSNTIWIAGFVNVLTSDPIGTNVISYVNLNDKIIQFKMLDLKYYNSRNITVNKKTNIVYIISTEGANNKNPNSTGVGIYSISIEDLKVNFYPIRSNYYFLLGLISNDNDNKLYITGLNKLIVNSKEKRVTNLFSFDCISNTIDNVYDFQSEDNLTCFSVTFNSKKKLIYANVYSWKVGLTLNPKTVVEGSIFVFDQKFNLIQKIENIYNTISSNVLITNKGNLWISDYKYVTNVDFGNNLLCFNKITDLEVNISNLSKIIGVLNGKITDLDSFSGNINVRSSHLEENVRSLTVRSGALENRTLDIENRTESLESGANALDNRVSLLEKQVDFIRKSKRIQPF
uniref:Uncharacterized protein n=1 Tax=viral metagenome TaxID=1070528 RepID=A0A6C0KRA4_9ZZZZ